MQTREATVATAEVFLLIGLANLHLPAEPTSLSGAAENATDAGLGLKPGAALVSGSFTPPLGRSDLLASLQISGAAEALHLAALEHMMQFRRNYLWPRLGSTPICCLSGRDGG